MSDFSDLKKRVDTFVKEIKAFSSSLSGSDDAEKQQQRYIELRDKKKEFALEVKDFEPAKKILMLESRKSTLLKSIQDELTKVEKAMTKQKIEVPKDDDADEDSTDKKGKKKKDEDQQDEGKSKGKKDKKDSGKSKSGKDDKKGKNKVEVVDDDSKSVTSAKSKKSELENDFVDTDEGEEGDAQADEAGELEENEEDQVEEAATSKEKGAAQLKEADKSDKKDRKSKDKKKDKSAAKKDKDSGKKGDKKSRKDSEKSAAPDEENEDEADEVDEGKSKKSKNSEKSKKDKESKKSKKDKASKKSKKTKEADEEEDEEEAGEDEKEEKKKDKRKSKEVEESKEDKKDKRKSKEVEESKEDKKSKAKEGKADSKETIEESKMEKVTAGQVQTAATGEARQQSFADDEEEFEEEEEEDDEDNEFPSEREDGGATYEMIMTRQTTQVQSSRPQLAAQAPAALAQAPAALVPPPTPAPRRNEDTATAESSRVTKVATHRLGKAPQRFEEEEEDDDEDKESGYDYENMRTLKPNESNSYEVVQSYSEDDPDIMPIQKGELLKVLKIGPDGWWLATNSRGREGLVPNTLLKPAPKDEEQEFDDEEYEASEYEDVTQADSQSVGTGYMVPNEMSQTDQTEPTEEYESDEDEDYEDEITADSNGVHEQQLPPGMPSGFRVSSLAKWFYEGTKRYPGRQFALQSLLHPKLSASCMSLQDGWGYTPQARPVATRIEKLVHLQKCLVMPHGLPVQVLDRFVRLCLFDGQGPVSNVHTVRATVTAKDDRTWSFGTRATDTSSGLGYGELYLRYNFGQNNVQLLLEATVVCKSETSEPIELSIGHVTVPLFDEKNGAPMPAKAFDLPFEGGTPFDHQQEVDSKLGQSGTQTKAKPHIQLKLTVPNKETKEFMDLCPTTILGNLANLQLHSLYRHVLASELGLSNQAIEHGANAIYAPHLVQFPIMADQPDLMDVLRRRWNEFAKRERAFRKPAASEVMKQEFIRIVKSTYFISQMKDFQPYAFGNKTQEQFRANAIQDFLRKIATDQSAVSFSLSSDLIFEPFSMQEVALPMIGQFSVPVLPVASE